MRPSKPVVTFAIAVLVIVAGAALTLHRWQAQLRAGRAQMLARLLATEHAPRMIEAPGVEAWLLGLLRAAGTELPAPERAAYDKLLHPAWAPQLPPSMVPVGEHLHAPPPAEAPSPVARRQVPPAAIEGGARVQPLRTVEHLTLRGHTLVLTRRRGLAAAPSLPPELLQCATHLVALAEGWSAVRADAEGPAGPDAAPLSLSPRVVRLYAVAEDGSFLSLPLPEPEHRDDAEARARVLAAETLQSQRRPRAPSLGSDSMFLEFDYGQPLRGQTHYTGIYTDVAGSGFVATVSAPVLYERDGLKMVVAADLAVDLALPRLVAAAEPSMQLVATLPVRELRTPLWQPWSTLVGSLPPDAPEELRRQVQLRAIREAREDLWAPQRSLVHHSPEDGRGVLFALQVSRRGWLVGWLAEPPAPLPWAPMVLVPGLLLGLLALGERRRARQSRALARSSDAAVADARQDERNRLAAILEHGADTLARVLAARLAAADDEEARTFCRWLADYLLRRLHMTPWVLARFGGPPSHEVGCILGPEHLHEALARYERIFAIVGADAALRAQLHWHNGTLSSPTPPGEPVLRTWIDWPPGWRLTAPTDGAFGFVLGEALVNAIKHGAPGVAVELDVDLDRGRRELCLRLRNHVPTAPAEPSAPEPGSAGPRSAKPYGGLAIVIELARICGWPLSHRVQDDRFELMWRCPVTRQREPGQVD